MNPEFAIELLKNLMFLAATVSLPFLLTAMVIGLGVSGIAMCEAAKAIGAIPIGFDEKTGDVPAVMAAFDRLHSQSLAANDKGPFALGLKIAKRPDRLPEQRFGL